MPKRMRSPDTTTSESESSDGSSNTTTSESGASEGSSHCGLPKKSAKRYRQVWDDFMRWLPANTGYKPNIRSLKEPLEGHITAYFRDLHGSREMRANTIWSYYSIINTGYVKHFGKTLKERAPRLTARLKQYAKEEEAPVRRAATFDGNDIVNYMQRVTSNMDDTQEKALYTLAYFGGLRCAELRLLSIENIRADKEGVIRVVYKACKAAAQTQRTFFVPLSPSHGNAFTAAVTAHLKNLQNAGITTGPVARRISQDKTSILQTPVGKNTLYHLPKSVARKLGKADADSYSGHSLRRTSAKMAADGGATTFDLRRHYGWVSEKTPQTYVDQSAAKNQHMASLLVSNVAPSVPSQPSQDSAVQLTQTTMSQVQSTQRVTIDVNLNITTK